jgi:alpha-beta hydrolase superfamily lysophospholipase
VLGAEKDFIVDAEGVCETAAYLGVEPVIIPGAYHDVMLGSMAKTTSRVIFEWIQKIACKAK